MLSVVNDCHDFNFYITALGNPIADFEDHAARVCNGEILVMHNRIFWYLPYNNIVLVYRHIPKRQYIGLGLGSLD